MHSDSIGAGSEVGRDAEAVLDASDLDLFAQSRACARGIPVSADQERVMPSFRIEMRDGSPQSRPGGSPAAAAVD